MNWIREHIENSGAVANIPFKKDRKEPGAFDADLYKERNRVERFFNKIKHLRRIATRYEKTRRQLPRHDQTRSHTRMVPL